jgi:peptide/nickel transport system ATP-binding protein
MSGNLLDVDNLSVRIGTRRGVVSAVAGVSLGLDSGTSLGIVGESGSGKSILVRAIMGLLPPRAVRSGSIIFDGQDLMALRPKDALGLWGSQISMIFQDPGRSLNPVVKIERQLTEGMRRHLGVTRSEARERALRLLNEVGVPDPERRLRTYPHELSGGMRQRVMIAIALSCEPKLLIADEPTTALDVTVQRQIIDLLREVQQRRGMSMIMISHDLSIIAGHTDTAAVMYAGSMCEIGDTRALFADPQHRYTEALLEATPKMDTPRHTRMGVIRGSLPDPTAPKTGCGFAPRCDHTVEGCFSAPPVLESVLSQTPTDHRVACVNIVGSGVKSI